MQAGLYLHFIVHLLSKFYKLLRLVFSRFSNIITLPLNNLQLIKCSCLQWNVLKNMFSDKIKKSNLYFNEIILKRNFTQFY